MFLISGKMDVVLFLVSHIFCMAITIWCSELTFAHEFIVCNCLYNHHFIDSLCITHVWFSCFVNKSN